MPSQKNMMSFRTSQNFCSCVWPLTSGWEQENKIINKMSRSFMCLNCNYNNKTADGAHGSFITNTVQHNSSCYWNCRAVQLSQVYLTMTVHASSTCLLCDGLLYNGMERDEWGVKWGVDWQAVPLCPSTELPGHLLWRYKASLWSWLMEYLTFYSDVCPWNPLWRYQLITAGAPGW